MHIDHRLFLSGATNRDDADSITKLSDDRRPVLSADLAEHKESRLVLGPRGDLDQIRIIPKRLGLDEVDPVLVLV